MKLGKGIVAFLSAILLVAFTVTSAWAAERQRTFNWRVPTVWLSSTPDFKALEEAFDNIRVMSGGRLNLRAFPSGALMPMGGVYDAVMAGTVQMGVSYPNFQFGKNRAWGIMGDEPFGFRRIEPYLQWLYFGGGTEFANQLANKDGIMWRPASATATQTGAFCPVPIRNLAEAKGKSMRIGSGTWMDALRNAGINPTNFAIEELYGALERKVVDMCEWTTPSIDWYLNFHEVAPHVIGPGWWQSTGTADFLINQREFNRLPEDLQAILLTGLRDFSLHTSLRINHLDAIYQKQLEEFGVTFYRWPDEDLKGLNADVQKTLQGLAAQDPFFKEILESRRAYKKQYDAYHEFMRFAEFDN